MPKASYSNSEPPHSGIVSLSDVCAGSVEKEKINRKKLAASNFRKPFICFSVVAQNH
jgi:hypothetical protein